MLHEHCLPGEQDSIKQHDHHTCDLKTDLFLSYACIYITIYLLIIYLSI